MEDKPLAVHLDKYRGQAGVLLKTGLVARVHRKSSQTPNQARIANDTPFDRLLGIAGTDDSGKEVLKQIGPDPIIQFGPVNGVNPVAGEEDRLRVPDAQKSIEILLAQVLESPVKGGFEIFHIAC